MHPGRGPGLTTRRLGENLGVKTVTLSEAQIPSHTHTARAASGSSSPGAPTNTSSFARSGGGDTAYQTDINANLVDLASETLSTVGGGQSHDNVQPYLTMNFIIALVGLYPSRS